MFGRIVCCLTVLLIGSLTLRAATVQPDMSNCGPPVHLTPVFRIPPGAGGSSTECLITNDPILKLDFFFAAPPSAPDTSCLSGLFAVCDISENLGITHVAFSAGTGPGIAASETFDVAFTGFPDGKAITQVANSPEPGSLPMLLIILTVWALYRFAWRALRIASR